MILPLVQIRRIVAAGGDLEVKDKVQLACAQRTHEI
jgi:hypothetical protein